MLKRAVQDDLWRQASNPVSLEEAVDSVFPDAMRRSTATQLLRELITILPYRCGVRMGEDRITFLIGGYRPAAILRRYQGVELCLVFVRGLPVGYWRTHEFDPRRLENTYEGTIIVVTPGQVISSLSREALDSFLCACERMRVAVPKTRRFDCNVEVDWPHDKPWPYAQLSQDGQLKCVA